jgi:hypothetical protein
LPACTDAHNCCGVAEAFFGLALLLKLGGIGGRGGRFDAEDSDLFGLECPAVPADRIFDVLAPDTPVLWLVLPKISAELPFAADGLAGTGGKVSPPSFFPAETLDTAPGLLFSWRLFEYLIADTAMVAEMQMPSNNPRISCRRFTERNLCMGTSSPVAAISPAGASEALESTESSLPDRMPLDRIGARGLRAFGANPAASISPRAGNWALKTSEPSPLDKVGVRCERAFETNLAIASGSLGITLEGRPPTA